MAEGKEGWARKPADRNSGKTGNGRGSESLPRRLNEEHRSSDSPSEYQENPGGKNEEESDNKTKGR